MRKLSVGLLVLLCTALCAGTAWAQVSAAALSGTVQDSSGGVLPGATVMC